MTAKEGLQARIQREIGELTESISGLVEGFKKLQRPLVESHEKVPQATNQLDKISAQTEQATHRMLDMIEKITQREEEVIGGIQQLREKAAAGDTSDIEQSCTTITQRAQQNLDDAYMIMDSLQFQDITAQQMNHAASILEEIESKLHQILSGIGAPVRKEESDQPRRQRAFDPHADFVDRQANQADIDSLFEQKQK